MRVLLFSSSSRNQLLHKTALEQMLHTVTVLDDLTLIADTLIIYDFDLIILDLPNFPSEDEQLSLLRKCSKINTEAALLVLAEYSCPDARLTALQCGAHDCLTGIFDSRKFEIIVNSLMRWKEDKTAKHSYYGPLCLDRSRHLVEMDGKSIKLTPKEFILLELLIKRSGRIVTTELIMSHIFDIREYQEAKLIHPHISRLRAKIKHPGINIRSEYGIGYRLQVSS